MADKLAYICAAAALLATLAYTGVLTPPHEISDCQDICEPTASKLIMVLLESQRYLNDVYASGTRNHTFDRMAESNQNSFTAQSVIDKVFKSQAAETEGRQKGKVTVALQVFLFFNACALFSSVTCLVVACSSVYRFKETQADSANLIIERAIEKECIALLAVSAAAAYVAFVSAHFQVYWLGSFSQTQVLPVFLSLAGFFLVIAGLGWMGKLSPPYACPI